jgi:hypothetical protein
MLKMPSGEFPHTRTTAATFVAQNRGNHMSTLNSVVAIYKNHSQAEDAVKELQTAGMNMKSLSIVGKDTYSDEHVIGYYNAGDRMKYWGKTGAFWGGFWGLLFGSAVFLIPGFGPIVVAGPLVAWIVAGLESAAIVGGLSAVGAGLFSIGIPKDSVLKYEVALKTDKYLLIVHGSPAEVEKAKDVISGTPHSFYTVHGEQVCVKQPLGESSPSIVPASEHQNKSNSRCRMDAVADELAEKGSNTERAYDQEHTIFSK